MLWFISYDQGYCYASFHITGQHFSSFQKLDTMKVAMICLVALVVMAVAQAAPAEEGTKDWQKLRLGREIESRQSRGPGDWGRSIETVEDGKKSDAGASQFWKSLALQ